MPIGFDGGDFGGGTAGGDRTDWRSEDEQEADPRDALDPWRAVREPVASEERELGFWTWVLIERRALVPEPWTRWATVEDERVCPECGPLDGSAWPVGEGPAPPLHVNCRCARVHAYTLWRIRATRGWELRWVPG
jgi:hypothetical protein